MKVIRSVSFEESDANSTRTISLDSSTTVDEISKITSLHINFVENCIESTDRSQKETDGHYP